MPRKNSHIEQYPQSTRYHIFFARVSALFFRHDPVGINFGDDNQDEYDPEAGSVIPRLISCQDVQDVERVLHEEFVRWFDADIAGPQERYTPIAAELWELWLEYREETKQA